MARNYLGIDIGTCSLKLAQCGAQGAPRVAVVQMPDNLVRDGKIISYSAMADFIRKALREHRMMGRRCAVVLPAGVAFLRRVTMPAMPEAQLKYNLPYEFRDYVEQGKDRFFYDYAVLDTTAGEDGSPHEMDLLAAAVPKETIADYRAMLRRAGLRLEIAAPAECAYANLIGAYQRGQPEMLQTEYCIIDLGYSATRIYIYSNTRFETMRAIEIGCIDIDRAIASSFNVDPHTAHTYRDTNHEGALAVDTVRDVYAAISVEVMKAVNFYSFNNRGGALSHAYVCGGGALIEPLRTAIGQATAMEMHDIYQLMPQADEQDAAEHALCASAIGVTEQ